MLPGTMYQIVDGERRQAGGDFKLVTIPAASLPVGVDPLNASYGDGNYGGASGSSSVIVTSSSGTQGFVITGSAVTIAPGATTGNTSTITITPSGGFTGSVVLSATIASSPAGATNLPTFSFGSTSPVNIDGTAAGTATLAITTSTGGGCAQANKLTVDCPGTPEALAWHACFALASRCIADV